MQDGRGQRPPREQSQGDAGNRSDIRLPGHQRWPPPALRGALRTPGLTGRLVSGAPGRNRNLPVRPDDPPPPPPPVLTQLPRRGSPQVRTDASEHGRPETVITTPWWRPVDSRGTQQGGARSPLVQTRFLLTQMAIYLCPWIPSPTEKSQGAVTPVWPFLPGPPYLSLWKAGRF